MISELHGSVPKIPYAYCTTLINRARADVYRQNLWSFNLFDSNWVAPTPINAGTVTTVQGTNTITFNATAITAINAAALIPTPITQRQFRQGFNTTYKIWAYNTSTGIATLDRNFLETGGSGQSYSIFQAYYPTPMQDFLGLISVRDNINFVDLFTDRYSREALDEIDPQRSWFGTPTDVVFYGPDLNPASATLNFPMFEIWGNPQFNIVWQVYGIRKGLPLVNPTDALPPAIGEDCVLALARAYAYQWAMANSGDLPRNQSVGWSYLIGEAKNDYLRLFRAYRKDDRQIVDSFFTHRRVGPLAKLYGYYNALSQTAYAGDPM